MRRTYRGDLFQCILFIGIIGMLYFHFRIACSFVNKCLINNAAVWVWSILMSWSKRTNFLFLKRDLVKRLGSLPLVNKQFRCTACILHSAVFHQVYCYFRRVDLTPCIESTWNQSQISQSIFNDNNFSIGVCCKWAMQAR